LKESGLPTTTLFGTMIMTASLCGIIFQKLSYLSAGIHRCAVDYLTYQAHLTL